MGESVRTSDLIHSYFTLFLQSGKLGRFTSLPRDSELLVFNAIAEARLRSPVPHLELFSIVTEKYIVWCFLEKLKLN